MLWLKTMPAERWMAATGAAVMAVGLGGVAFAASVLALLLCVALFSAVALLAAPSQQTVAAEFANPTALGSDLGVNALALAIGGGLGNYSGGLLYGLGRQNASPALPWMVFVTVGALAAVGMLLLQHRQAGRALNTAPDTEIVIEL